MVKKEVISEEEQIYYTYGIESTLDDLFITSVIFLIGILIGKFQLTVCFFILFTFLHTQTGGYHCKTFRNCFILSIFLYLVTVIGLTNISYTKLEINIIFITAIFIFWFMTPLIDNKKVSGVKQIRTRITLIIYIIGFYICFYIDVLTTAYMISTILTLILVIMSFIANRYAILKNKKKRSLS